LWQKISSASGQVYDWPKSTYIAEPPFFEGFGMQPGKTGNIIGARTLGIFGDSVTTDHISPRRIDQAEFTRRRVPARARRAGHGLQQLRRPGAATTT